MTTTTNEAFEDTLSSRDDEYVPVGLDGILSATQKALAMNRGLVGSDHRDGLGFKRLMSTADLMAERVRMDATGSLRKLVQHSARQRTLKGFSPGALDDLIEKHITQSSLSSPLEEINPLDVMNQARRVTMLGPGGISSADMITPAMQAVHASSFGYLSAIEGPECFDDLTEVFTQRGWQKWASVTLRDKFACRVDGKFEWNHASRIIAEDYNGIMIKGENESIRMCVTPNHRVLYTCTGSGKITYHVKTADQVFGRIIRVPIKHNPLQVNEDLKTFDLPEVPVTNNYQKVHPPLDINDWAEFLGWWLAEGSSYEAFSESEGHVKRAISIAQCATANPSKFERIYALLLRLGFITDKHKKSGRAFSMASKQLFEYFRVWQHGCYDKWIPEECFGWPIKAKTKMLEALLLGDGRFNKKRMCYCTVSYKLALSVERLAVELGYPAFIRIEKDSREHVKTVNYIVSISRAKHRTLKSKVNGHSNGKQYGDYWSKQQYSGKVYCATVPGGLLLVRGKPSTAGFWSGNSSSAGVDTRLSNGTKLGSNGRIYQKFRNPRTGDIHWLAPEDLQGKVVGLPR